MPLSDDQKAMLRLLAQSDVSYEDIAALKGKSVEEVKAEVEAALAELDRAEAEQPAPAPPEPAPAPPPPPAPEKPAPIAPRPSPTAKRPPRPTRAPVPVQRRRLLAFMGGALALVAVVIGVIALVGGSDDSGSQSVDTASELAAVEEDDRVTRAVLEPPAGGDGRGIALFGRLGKEEVVLQVTAEGLDPTPDGESYTVWLYRSPKVALRIGSVKVEEGQELAARFPIPAELLAYVAGGAFKQINVSRTSDAAYKREIAQAQKQERLPSYSGDTVLSGEIVGPIAEAAQKQK